MTKVLLCGNIITMNMTTFTSKGQATFPEEVRTALGIQAGDKVLFSNLDPLKKRGEFKVVSTKNVVDELYGSLKSKVPYAPMWKSRKAIGPFLARERGLIK